MDIAHIESPARLARRLAAAAALAGALGSVPAHAAPEGTERMRAFARELLASELYDESIAAFRAIAQHLADDPRAHYDLAGALAFLRRYPEAVEPVERALALSPDDVVYLELAAITYQQVQRYGEAFRATRRGAELGDVKAMYTLAGMFEHGRGTAASPVRALEWLQRAAESGHLGAMAGMAQVYRDGLYGQPRDAARAASWDRRLERELAR